MGNKLSDYSIMDRAVSKTKYVNHVFRRVTGFNKNGATTEPIEINVEVIILPGGGLILPYFKNSRGRWSVVLVSQYRPAVKSTTLEAPGGILDSKFPKVALARELLEETGIRVSWQSIKIVVIEYTHPSILSNYNIGGIVRVDPKMVLNKKMAGKRCENERTQVEVFDLIELIKNREMSMMTFDLMTSRLIDEVAKTVGLLVKKY